MQVICPRCDEAPDASAKVGETCSVCGTRLVQRERTRRTSAIDDILGPQRSGSAGPAEPPLALPATLELDVVDLGERTGTAPATPRPSPVTTEPEPEPLSTLAPPVEDAPLELDAEWQKEKAARQQAPSEGARRVANDRAMQPPPPSGDTPWLLIILVLAGLGAGGYYVMTRTPSAPAQSAPAAEPSTPPPEPPRRDESAPSTMVPKRGVTIRIVGAPGTPITIDGAAAGKTPLTLQRSGGAKRITVKTPLVTFQVVPDHDQTVDITAPP